MQNNRILVIAALVAGAIGLFLSYQIGPGSAVSTAAQQNVRFQTLSGKTVTEQDWQGNWVIVNYFAEWCAPCLKEIPELNALQRRIVEEQQNLQLYAMSYDALDEQQLFALKQKYNMVFPLIRTQPIPLLPIDKPRQLPATFVISPDGEVLKTLWGEQTNDGLWQVLQSLRVQ